jgi:hypothetical protein
MKSPRMVFALSFALSSCFSLGQSQLFSDEEVRTATAFWNQEGRQTITATVQHQVRLTVAASKWLWDYNAKRGKGKVAPGTIAPPTNAREEIWEAWINAKVSRDRYLASIVASQLNKGSTKPLPEAKDPGFPPADLTELVGPVPLFAQVVLPNQYVIKFDDTTITYRDYVDMRPRYAYYRFDEGTNSAGTKMGDLPSDLLNSLLEGAGINPSEQKVFKAISLLEGGFDSVNTYDTGFVSVGFIQFASLKEGGHSLGETLRDYKKEDPDGFKSDFTRFGINVTDEGLLAALDFETGRTRIGADGNRQIIQDKRLTAVFQRAGRGTGYRQIQLKAAKRIYWPMKDKISPTVNGKPMPGILSDVIKSEAGQSVFLDRKVNTGSIGPINDVLSEIAKLKPIKSLSDFSKYEALIIQCLWYRFNPMTKGDLFAPEPCEMIPAILAKYGRITQSKQK